ncbi:MAG: hypothetical protein EON58_00060 [Alphaproteobacteria bacterium]|nr:MAG: hypothetical protein EON58_00060 [Alphaproteobacteria bacterium]
MQGPRPKLIFRSAAGHWRRSSRAATDAPIKVFSPYITGKHTLQLTAGHRRAEVYTLFDAELFASRSSDLVQLRRLVEAKVEVYLLPGLHAKVVWLPEMYLSIGSQNLTSRGLRNKEATATFAHKPWLTQVGAKLDRWTACRQPITLKMIADMEIAVAPLRREFQVMKKKLTHVDLQVQQAEATRESLRKEAAVRRRRENEQDRQALFERSFQRLRTSIEMTAVVRKFATGRVSLVAAPGHSFLRWSIDGEQVDLKTFQRYLCVVPELGRLGWARVSNGLVSYFESGVRREAARVLGKKCIVEWSASERLNPTDHNLSFSVTGHPELPDFTITAWVDAETIEFVDDGDLAKEIRRRKTEISADIVRQLTRPFRYGRRLTGKTASEFLHAHIGSEFRVRVARLAGHTILVAEAVSRPLDG